jgi:hypothetical protein
MALTYEQFINKTGAKRVAGQLILGSLGSRFVAGFRKNGVFIITFEGEEYLANMENAVPEVPVVEEKPKRGRRKKEIVESLEPDVDFGQLLLEDE